MKERFIAAGLGVGAALALGIAWTDSAQAFSLGTPVTVTNILDKTNSGEDVFDGPETVTIVEDGVTLDRFGDLWDISLSDRSISFSLDSPFFANVTSGIDRYRFKAQNFGQVGSLSLFGAKVTTFGVFEQNPLAIIVGSDQLDIVFPLGFAAGDFRTMTGKLGLNIELDLRPTPEPTPVPTPALLPGLVGMGLAVLRRRQGDSPPE